MGGMTVGCATIGLPDCKEDFGEATGELSRGVFMGIDGLIDRGLSDVRKEVAVKWFAGGLGVDG